MSRRKEKAFSAFDAWFVRQFGPRPSDKSMMELCEERNSTKWAAERAQKLVEAVDLWEDKRQAASYAWNISDERKKPGGME